jgi:BMFP domain-containing protein YqiC
MQTRNRLLDDLAKVANSAVGTVTGMKDEVEQMIRHRVENFIGGMNLVTREEFDVVQAMVVKSREEQEKLKIRIVELETPLESQSLNKTTKKTAAKKPNTIKGSRKT